MDPEAFRDEARARWDAAAAGWEARRADFQRAAQPVSMWMIDHLDPQPGHTILELAAGPGDTGLLAAELVQPGGTVILTDTSPNMVEAAERRAEELGIRNVEARVDGGRVDRPADGRRSTASCAASATCSSPTPRRACARRAASCAAAAASRSPRGRPATRTRG